MEIIEVEKHDDPETAEPVASEIVTTPPQDAETVLGLYTPKQIELIKRTVAKDTTNDELAMFLHISKKAGLDPFLKEIWCYKDNKNNTIIFAGRDGFKRVAEASGFFNGLKSGAVHENDDFSIDLYTGEISHKIISPSARGKLVGAWAVARRTDRQEPAVEYVEADTYNKGWNTWKSHPDEMLRKVAEVHALKTLFIINGVYSEEERASIIAQSEVGKLEAPQNPKPKTTKILPEPENVWVQKLTDKLQSIELGIEGQDESLLTLDQRLSFFIEGAEMPTEEKEAQQMYIKLMSIINKK